MKSKNYYQLSHSFISQWKNQALFHIVESLKLQYQARKSHLKPEETEKTIGCLREQDHLRLSDFQNFFTMQFSHNQ